jgi:hypothetical protein
VFVAIAAVLVLAGVVTTILLSNSPGGEVDPRKVGAQPTQSVPAQNSEEDPPTSSTSSPPPPQPISPDAPIGYSDAGNLVIDYYGTFSDQVGRWNMLSTNAKAQFGGQAAFDQYWSQFTDVSSENARGVTENGDGSLNVPVDVTYTRGDGTQQVKRQVRVTREGGRIVIDSLAQ